MEGRAWGLRMGLLAAACALVLLATPAAAHCTTRIASLNLAPGSSGSGEDPHTVTFVLDGYVEGDCYIEEWVLEFGDGAPSAGGNGDPEGRQETHTYTIPGANSVESFVAELTIYDNQELTASSERVITVFRSNEPPTASVVADPPSGTAPLQVTFDLAADDADGGIASWELDFGDGEGTGGSGDPTGREPRHTYAEGTFTARFTVRDDEGDAAEDAATITVGSGTNRAPAARLAASPGAGEAPLDVEFALEASDPDGASDLASWVLEFGDGGSAQGSGSADGSRLRHRYEAGAWEAKLTVRDARGAAGSAVAPVRASIGGNLPPAVRLAAEPDGGAAPLKAVLRAEARDPDGGAVHWSLDFGDGAALAEGQGPLDRAFEHTYREAGVHAAVLRAEDEDGGVATARVDVRVSSAPGARSPGLRLTVAPLEGPAPLAATVAFATKAGFDRVANWSVDFGDGARAAGLGDPGGLVLHHAYRDPGTFVVAARLGLDSGLALEERATLAIAPAPPAPAAAGPALALLAEPPVVAGPGDVRLVAAATPALEGTWSLDFGDGSALTFEGLSSGLEVVHRYGAAGAYEPTLRVDGPGASATAQAAVRVGGGAPPLAVQQSAMTPLAAAGALPLALLALAAAGARRPRAALLVALLAGASLLGPAGAYMNLRHLGQAHTFTADTDFIEARWDADEPWPMSVSGFTKVQNLAVLTPNATSGQFVRAYRGANFTSIGGGQPAAGTWGVAYAPACDEKELPPGVGYDLTWSIAGRTGRQRVDGCSPAVWLWNWAPSVSDGTEQQGTILFATLGRAYANDTEGKEGTFYNDAGPYYNLDNTFYDSGSINPNRVPPMRPEDADNDLDGLSGQREVWHYNSNPASDRSRPEDDDDGDGVRNIFDDDPWWAAHATTWADSIVGDVGDDPLLPDVPYVAVADPRRHTAQAPPPPSPALPSIRPDLMRAALLAALAGAAPEGALADGAALATPATGTEGPDALWEQTRETVRLTLTNRRPAGDGSARLDRGVTDVVLRFPADAPLSVDVPSTALATGWRLVADQRGNEVRGLWWSGGRIPAGASEAFPIVLEAQARSQPWSGNLTVLTYEATPGDDARAAVVPLRVLDDEAPPLTVQDPAVRVVRRDTALRLRPADAGSGVDYTEVALDDEAPRRSRAVVLHAPADGSNEGPHTLRFRSVDHTGNVEDWREAPVLVDTRAPRTTLEVPAMPQTEAFEVRLDADDDGGSGVAAVRWRLWLQGTARPAQAQEGTVVRVAEDGLWLLEVAAEDVAGNVEPARLAALHLDGPTKLALEADAPAAAVPGATWAAQLRARNLAGEVADEPRLEAALPPGFAVVAAEPPLAQAAPPAWNLPPLGPGAAWEATLTLRAPRESLPGPAGALALALTARYATGPRTATLDVPVATGPLHRLDLACPEAAALDAQGRARFVCLLRNTGNLPSEAALAPGEGARLETRLPLDPDGWRGPADPLAPPLLGLPAGEARVLALTAEAVAGPLALEARGTGGAVAAATVALAARPMRGLLAEPDDGGVRVLNVGRVAEAVGQPPAALAPGAALRLPAPLAQELAIAWSGPALAAAPRPVPLVAARTVAGSAQPALDGALRFEGDEAVLELALRGPDGEPLAGARVRAEDANATLDAAGAATLRGPARRFADGFAVQVEEPRMVWQVQPPLRRAAASWEVTLRPDGVEARLAGAPAEVRVPAQVEWRLRQNAREHAVVAPAAEGGYAFGLAPSAQELLLAAPAFAGAATLRGGGAEGALLALESVPFRAPVRPVSLAVGIDGARWTVEVHNGAALTAQRLRWTLLGPVGEPLAEGAAPLDVGSGGVGAVRLALPAELLAGASAVRFAVAFEGGLTAVLPDEPVPPPAPERLQGAAIPGAGALVAGLALAAAGMLVRRRGRVP